MSGPAAEVLAQIKEEGRKGPGSGRKGPACPKVGGEYLHGVFTWFIWFISTGIGRPIVLLNVLKASGRFWYRSVWENIRILWNCTGSLDW